MATVTEYYIVPKEIYEKCSEPPESIVEKIDKLPKQAKYNSSRLLEHLRTQLTWDTTTGLTPGLLENIFNYINYSVRGKKRPFDFQEFLQYIISVPASLLCEKAKREVKKYKRNHGRLVRAPRMD